MIINKFLYKLWILYYDRINVFEVIDVNNPIESSESSESEECDICRYWYF